MSYGGLTTGVRQKTVVRPIVNRVPGSGFQKCNCFKTITDHVDRCMRSGRVRIFNGNQRETLSLITQERIGVGALNLVGIIDVGVDACGILSRSVGQTNRK